MKKISTLLVALMATFVSVNAVDFAYEAGAEVVSAYIWRGQYNGGLSFQPTASVGLTPRTRKSSSASEHGEQWVRRTGNSRKIFLIRTKTI